MSHHLIALIHEGVIYMRRLFADQVQVYELDRKRVLVKVEEEWFGPSMIHMNEESSSELRWIAILYQRKPHEVLFATAQDGFRVLSEKERVRFTMTNAFCKK